ncbi:hypothetical protein [Streptomyces sp. enrichment culture]|uniref:hypothetical protein n=1 Tax=Streptomyces sp. enrichment culture TaxID=1795815 RepID=UPI003F57983B
MVTGQPKALPEGWVISAQGGRRERRVRGGHVGLVRLRHRRLPGLLRCDRLRNLACLKAVVTDLVAVPVSDLDDARAEAFTARCREHWPDLKTEVALSVEETLSAHRLVCLATTNAAPHPTTGACRRGTLVLHVSRRDLTPGRG